MPDILDPSELSATPPPATGNPQIVDASELSAAPPQKPETPQSTGNGKPAPAEPQIRAYTPTVLDYLRRFLFGGPNGETALGRAFPSMSGAKMGDGQPMNPVRFEELVPNTPDAPGGTPGYMGIPQMPHSSATLSGIGKGLTDATSAQNLPIIAGTQGLGLLGEAAPVLGRMANTALSAYFAGEMGKNASQAMQQAKAAHDAGNDDEAARLLGYGSISGLLGAVAAAHGINSARKLPADLGEKIDAHNQQAANLVAQDAKQGQGVQLGQTIVPAPVPVKDAQGVEYSLVNLGASKEGRPNYAVVDATGKTVFGGNGRDVQDWLRSRGAQPNTPAPAAQEPAPIVRQAEAPVPSTNPTEPTPAAPEVVDPSELSATPPQVSESSKPAEPEPTKTTEIPAPAPEPAPQPAVSATPTSSTTKPVTPQVDDGTKYVLPSFVTAQYAKPESKPAPSAETGNAELPPAVRATQGLKPTYQLKTKGGSAFVTVAQGDNGEWHYDSDYRIRGFHEGSGGSPDAGFPTRDEALTAALSSIQRIVGPDIDTKSSAATKSHRLTAAQIVQWASSLYPKPAPDSTVESPAVVDASELSATPPSAPQVFSVPHDGMLTVIAAKPDHQGTPPDVASLPFARQALADRGLSNENVIGAATFTPLGHQDGSYHASAVEVVPEWRRKGIASALYDHAGQTLGAPIAPSQAQTENGKAFSDARLAKGPHGPIFHEYAGDWRGARDRLLKEETGEAPGALLHPEVEPADLIFGEEGQSHQKGYGLAKIRKWHKEVLEDLGDIYARLPVVERTDNSIRLSDGRFYAVIRRNWKGTPKTWLLTEFDQTAGNAEPSAGRTMDVPGTHAPERQTPPAGGPSSSIEAQAPESNIPESREVPGLAHPKMGALVDAIQHRIENGPPIKDTPALVKLAAEHLGDPLTSGKYDVKDLYDALEAAVNRMVLTSPRIMESQPSDALKGLQAITATLPTQTARTKEQREFQQFSTPPALSYLAAKAAAIRPGETVLEPSAGTGSLAAFAKAAGAEVETNELGTGRAALLELLGFVPTRYNAERIRDHRPDLQPDVVLMNPPFSATAGRKSTNKNSVGFQHVLSALDTLPEGGRLVAILGRGASFDHPTALPLWKGIKERGATVRANIGLDGSNYSKYGTTFDNRLIIIDKVQAAEKPVVGDFKDLAEAYDALRPIIDSRPARRSDQEAGSGTALEGSADSGSAVAEGSLPADSSGNGKRGSGQRRPRQSPVHVEPAGPGGDVAPTTRPELSTGPVDAVTPAPTDHAGADRTPERQQSSLELKTRTASDDDKVERQGAYQQYRPAKLATGVSHEKATGTGLVETGAMASVEPPDINYSPHLPARVIESGHITDAQLEAIAYAGQAQQDVTMQADEKTGEYSAGKRLGFMVGDGTGVGKGTIAAGIALDNWNQGRRRILWLSLKPGLIRQAQRDLDWVEAPIKARMLNDWDFSEPIDHEGVVFATYSMLHRVAGKQGGGSRLEQLLKWNPQVILMDESHAAKNAVADGEGDEPEGGRANLAGTASKAGQAVLDLDKGLPDTRITYFSATAFTDTRNLGYATRLGLWGPGTSFPEGFKDFNVQIDRGGYGAMELVAKEMKATGRYIARQISFEGVDYRELTAHLTAAQREMYDVAVNAWQSIFRNIDKAIEATTGADEKKAKGLQRMRAVSQFWSTNQRFYRGLITAMKIPTVIAEIESALDRGNSVFLDLVSTGEAEAQRQLVKATEDNLTFDDLDMSSKAMLNSYLDSAFPTQLMEEYEDPETKAKRTRAVLDAKGNPVHSQEAIALRDAMKRDLEKIQLPQSPLDQIIEYFGPDAVAEVSGRKSRIVQDQKTGRAVEVKRVKPKGASAKDVNDWERQQFQNGNKRIAVASGAGGTGFDFHSDKRNANQQRRTHIVLEPSWSADQQMQKFGRTHRTNQANAPEYVLVASDLGGEKRFISAIAGRIASLGALTRGERKAGGGAAEMLARYNLEGKYGDAAKQAFFTGLGGGKAILQDDVTVNVPKMPAELEELGPMAVCRLLGVVRESEDGPRVDVPSLKQFMNRMLNLPTGIQGAAFNYFMELFDSIVETVKAAGVFDEGTTELKALRARITHKEVIRTAEDGTPTNHIVVSAEFPAEKNDWETALHHRKQGDEADYNQRQYAGLYRNKRSGKLWMARKSTKDITDQASGAMVPAMALLGPQAGSRQVIPVAQLADRERFERIPSLVGEQEKAWNAALAEIPDTVHQDIHLINGSVLPVWRQLGASGDDYKMDVVSIPTENGGSISGIRIPPEQINTLKTSLGGGGLSSPAMILNRVWRQGERIQLRDAALTASRIMGERAIVIQPGKTSGRAMLDQLGIPHVETASSVRYYLPYSDEPSAAQHEETLGKLTKVLNAFPIKGEEAPAPAATETNYEGAGLAGAFAQRWDKLFAGKAAGEPEQVWSRLGAIKSGLVRNLSQLEEVSPESHKAAVRAASGRAQSAALIRSAWPKVVAALKDKISADDFRRGLIETGLLGAQSRWLDLADAVDQVPKDELADWVLSGPLETLASMSDDGEPAQMAAALAANLQVLDKKKIRRDAYDRLRDLVHDAFEGAADSVHHMMTRDEFDTLTQKPEFQAALAAYKRDIEPTLAKNHASNEGIFTGALGPLNTYYPLTPIRTEDQARAFGARRGFKKPGNISNQFRTGLSSDYDPSMQAFADKVSAAMRVNDKAALVDTLEQSGILRKLAPGQSGDVIHFGGRALAAKVVEVGPARTILQDGKAIHVPAQRALLPKAFYHELKPILEPDEKRPPGIVSRVIHFINEATLAGPAEAVIHSHNLVGALIANTPFLGPELATKTIGNTPVTKTLTALIKIATTDPMDDRAVRDLGEMAKLGLLPERFGTETYSKQFADLTGAAHKYPGLNWGPFLYGPKGVDVRARLLMYRLAKEIDPNAGSVETYKFVNQLGNYTEALQGQVERSLKRTGLSRFVTAGSTMLRNGIDAWLGVGMGSGPGGGKGNRIAQMLSGGAVGLIAAWVLAYHAYTGKWPWEDRKAKLLKIPVSDEARRSPIGLALWGHDLRKTGYINFGVFSPLVARGARGLGLDGSFNTAREGGNLAQMGEAAKRDVANSAMHPIMGPTARLGMVAITGKQPYLVGDREGGNQFLTAMPKKAPIGSEILTAAKQLNSFYGNIGAATGFSPADDTKASSSDLILKAIVDMTGLSGGASNPNAARKALAEERRYHK